MKLTKISLKCVGYHETMAAVERLSATGGAAGRTLRCMSMAEYEAMRQAEPAPAQPDPTTLMHEDADRTVPTSKRHRPGMSIDSAMWAYRDNQNGMFTLEEASEWTAYATRTVREWLSKAMRRDWVSSTRVHTRRRGSSRCLFHFTPKGRAHQPSITTH